MPRHLQPRHGLITPQFAAVLILLQQYLSFRLFPVSGCLSAGNRGVLGFPEHVP